MTRKAPPAPKRRAATPAAKAPAAKVKAPARGARPAGKPDAAKRAARPDARPDARPGARPAAAAPLRAPVKQAKPAPETPARGAGMAGVEQAFDLLDALARLGPASQAALERASGCSQPLTERLLAVLEARGLAVHGQAGQSWQLGPRWNVFQRAAQSQGALAAASMPYLEALGKATGENIYLRVRNGMEAETIAVYQADPTLRVYTENGKRGPLHAGPSRLLLAHAPEAVQTQVLSQRLPRFTPATRTDPTWIAADLHRLRQRGYMITADEVNAGAASVSAPVRDASGQVIAVLILSAPSMRLKPPRPRQLLPQVMEAAAQLSRALGGPAGVVAVPAANGGPLPDQRPAASVPTSPASPAAWMR